MVAIGQAVDVLRDPLPTERTLLQGVVLARWGTWVWLTATTLIQRDDLAHPALAGVAVAVALGWCVLTTWALRRRPGVLVHPAWAVAELVLALVLLMADGLVFDAGHTLDGSQNLAGTWPLLAVLVAASALAPWVAGLGGAAVAAGRVLGGLVNGEPSPSGSRVVSFLSTAVFYAVAAVMWSWLARRLRLVETEVLARRARDDVARTLHDGVLQTLALVARRTSTVDPELAAVARTSDRELRAWLYGRAADGERADLAARLRAAADRVAAGYDLPVTVNVLADTEPRPAVADAVVGAVGEALTNAAKHAAATRVVVYVEADDDGAVFATVRDDGCGFDAMAARAAGRGIVRSIDERLALVGGRAELVSAPGEGTEVRLWAT